MAFFWSILGIFFDSCPGGNAQKPGFYKGMEKRAENKKLGKGSCTGCFYLFFGGSRQFQPVFGFGAVRIAL